MFLILPEIFLSDKIGNAAEDNCRFGFVCFMFSA